MSLYEREFPEMLPLPEASELLAKGWIDHSWHNDACPRFVSPDKKLAIWVDAKDPAMRDFSENDRFIVEEHQEFVDYTPDWQPLLATSDWEAVKDFIEEKQGEQA